jgi:hypothetical protein
MTRARIERDSCCNQVVAPSQSAGADHLPRVLSLTTNQNKSVNLAVNCSKKTINVQRPEPESNGLPAAIKCSITDCSCGPSTTGFPILNCELEKVSEIQRQRPKKILSNLQMTRARIERVACCHKSRISIQSAGADHPPRVLLSFILN